MTERDEDRRIEEELQRRERSLRDERNVRSGQNLRSERPTRQPQAAKPAGPPAAAPDVEALVRSLKAELDDMEGRMAAGIDAVAERVAPVPGAAADLAEWVRRATARGEAVDRLAPLLEEAVDRQNRLHRPARRRARAAGFVLALALAAVIALVVQWRFAVIETADPTDGWRDHVWQHYGPELRDCVIRAESQGRAMLCQVFDPKPELP